MNLLSLPTWLSFAKGLEKAMAPPLHYFCLENPMDGGAWWAAVHWVARVGHD